MACHSPRNGASTAYCCVVSLDQTGPALLRAAGGADDAAALDAEATGKGAAARAGPSGKTVADNAASVRMMRAADRASTGGRNRFRRRVSTGYGFAASRRNSEKPGSP